MAELLEESLLEFRTSTFSYGSSLGPQKEGIINHLPVPRAVEEDLPDISISICGIQCQCWKNDLLLLKSLYSLRGEEERGAMKSPWGSALMFLSFLDVSIWVFQIPTIMQQNIFLVKLTRKNFFRLSQRLFFFSSEDHNNNDY